MPKRVNPDVQRLRSEQEQTKAHQLIEQGDVEGGFRLLKSALAKRPRNISLLDDLTDVCFQMCDMKSAEQYIRKALSIDSITKDAAQRYCYLAQVEEDIVNQINDYTKALDIFQKKGVDGSAELAHSALTSLGQLMVQVGFTLGEAPEDEDGKAYKTYLSKNIKFDVWTRMQEVQRSLEELERAHSAELSFWCRVQKQLYNLMAEDYILSFKTTPRPNDEEFNTHMTQRAQELFQLFYEGGVLQNKTGETDIYGEGEEIEWANVIYMPETENSIALRERPEEVLDLVSQLVLYNAYDEACILCDMMLFDNDTNLAFLEPCATCHREKGRTQQARERYEDIIEALTGGLDDSELDPNTRALVAAYRREAETLSGEENEEMK